MSRRAGGVDLRWPRRLVRLCLRVWPERERHRDGAALEQALVDGWAATPRGGRAGSVVAECAAILWAGVGMRLRALRRRSARIGGGAALDARAAARALRRSPGFALTVAASFGLGIGANAAVFAVVDRVLFTPPPFERPGSLVFAWRTLDASGARHRLSAPLAAELARRAPTFASLAFVSRPVDGGIETAGDGRVEHVRVSRVSPNLLDVLGIGTLAVPRAPGRASLLDPPDGPVDGPGAVLLSHGAWTRAFAGDSAVVGTTVRLDGGRVRVAGVLPEGFSIAFPPDVGMGGAVDVLRILPGDLADVRRTDGRALDLDSDNTGAVIARLPVGVTVEQASVEADRVARELRAELTGDDGTALALTVRRIHEDATAHVRPLLSALLLAAGALLVVTCLNVSTLALARGARRRREAAVRACLGAARGDLLRATVIEALVLVAIGGLAAMLVADLCSTALAGLVPAGLGAGGAPLSPRALLLAVLVAAAATVTFTVAPVVSVFRAGPGGATYAMRGTERRGRGRDVMVAVQVGLSVVLVLTTGLIGRAASAAYRAEPGFRPDGALTFSLSVRSATRYPGPADRARLMRDIESALARLPGVTAVGLTTHLPLSGRLWTQPWAAGPGDVAWDGRADFRAVTSGYLDALGAELTAGRTFTSDEDLLEERRVALVDDLLARRLGGDESAIGSAITFPLDGATVRAEVVGVVRHVRHESPVRDGRETLYVPYRQEASRDVSFVIRTDGDPLRLAPSVRAAVRDVDAELPIHDLRTLSSRVDEVVGPTTFALGIVGAFASLVLLSVSVGLYGLISLEVGRRTREIGVRLALGSSPRSLATAVVARACALTLAGALAGAAAAALVAPIVTTATPGVAATDPVAWGAVVVAVVAVALLGSWLPLRRVARLDPVAALRSD